MDDTIRRTDAIEAFNGAELGTYTDPDKAAQEIIGTVPSANTHDLVHRDVIKPKLVDCTDFVLWLLDEVMDEENWELNAAANGEIICRKLKKLGLLEVKDGYYIRTSADRPQWEWKPKNHHTDYCSKCGFEETQWRTADYNFCPSCGARMKGADDDRI